MNWFPSHIAAWFTLPLLAFSAWFGFHDNSSPTSTQPVACTMEAKICPDGSAVGRTGPNCEFAQCPTTGSTSTPPVRKPTPTPTPVPVSAVTIYSISPTSGPVGTHVVITGFGFAKDNTISFGGDLIQHVPVSSSIAIACTNDPSCRPGIRQTLEFDVPDAINPSCYYSEPRCMIASRQTTPGNYKVFVQNSNGTSNTVIFTVTGATSAALHINSISPASGPIGTTVTIRGSGFSSDSVVLFSGGPVTHTTTGSSITFNVPQAVGANCRAGEMCPMYMRLITPGTYDVQVQNSDGTITSNAVSFTVTSGTNSTNPLSITGLDAPVTLPLGTQGTWTVHVSVPDSVGQLHYSATWGDEANTTNAQIMAPAPQQVQTSASFTHSYARSGNYTATFTVTDDQGHSAQTSSTITVTPLY